MRDEIAPDVPRGRQRLTFVNTLKETKGEAAIRERDVREACGGKGLNVSARQQGLLHDHLGRAHEVGGVGCLIGRDGEDLLEAVGIARQEIVEEEDVGIHHPHEAVDVPLRADVFDGGEVQEVVEGLGLGEIAVELNSPHADGEGVEFGRHLQPGRGPEVADQFDQVVLAEVNKRQSARGKAQKRFHNGGADGTGGADHGDAGVA